jgi:hypothetical protein
MPTHPAGLDPIVAEIIEALAGTIAHKDNNKRGGPGTKANKHERGDFHQPQAPHTM